MARSKSKAGGGSRNGPSHKGGARRSAVPSRDEVDEEGFGGGDESFVRLDGKRNQEDSDEEEAFDLAGSDLDDSDDDEKDGADEEVCFRESRSMHCAGG